MKMIVTDKKRNKRSKHVIKPQRNAIYLLFMFRFYQLTPSGYISQLSYRIFFELYSFSWLLSWLLPFRHANIKVYSYRSYKSLAFWRFGQVTFVHEGKFARTSSSLLICELEILGHYSKPKLLEFRIWWDDFHVFWVLTLMSSHWLNSAQNRTPDSWVESAKLFLCAMPSTP